MEERAELFENLSVPGYLILSGCISSGTNISTGCCGDKIHMGSDTQTTRSSTIAIMHLKKTQEGQGARKLFPIFSFYCCTFATLCLSLGDPPWLANFLPSFSWQTFKNSHGTVGGIFLPVPTEYSSTQSLILTSF